MKASAYSSVRGHFTKLNFAARVLALLVMGVVVAGARDAGEHWWSDAADKALSQSGTNKAEITRALEKAPTEQREGMQFLVENMPDWDLQNLGADKLLENMALANESFKSAPWHDQVPKEIFLNDILPYACVNETRDEWRKFLKEKCEPLVANCKTPGEAAMLLNHKIYDLFNVHYSTKRRKADQSPQESMVNGLASCTGLSILLVDACRAVGVPARVAGTPMWMNMRGNHTWVEVWDGDWHFTGASEPDEKGFDHGWFEHDASEAQKDNPQHAIYASSFKKTGLSFVMNWADDVDWVPAVNVTDRYTPKAKPIDPSKVRLLVKVLDQLAGKRVSAQVTVTDLTNSAVRFTGLSRDESVDMNDILPIEVPKGATYSIRAERFGMTAGREFTTGTNVQAVVVIALNEMPVVKFPSQACYVPPETSKNLKAEDETKLKQAVTEFFAAPAEKQATWKFPSRMEKLLRENDPAVRHAVWEAYKSESLHGDLKADFDAKRVHNGEYLSPYTVKTVGTRPAKGWALFIAMHGGGNTPKEVNDQQWGVMQRYYRDHPEAGGYKYVALRAPNDTWNGFYDDYVYPLVANLIDQFRIFGDVDGNKVFIMGYSHGGYGAFAIGPKEPDLFAAIHASAGAPTGDETTGKTLRNTIFTCMVGELDTAYGRKERNEKFRESIKGYRGERTDIYPVTVSIISGNAHTGLPDRDKIKEMYPAVRNPAPRELTWLMTDKVISDFFWLHTDTPGKDEEIDAACRDNHVVVTTTGNIGSAKIELDGRLVDFDKPVTIELNGQRMTKKVQPSLRTLCETLQRRGDPDLAFTVEIALPLAAKQAAKLSVKFWVIGVAMAALSARGEDSKFPCPDDDIPRFTAYRVSEPIKVDGHLDEKAWQLAPRSARFADILTGKRAIHDTRVSVLWDDENLYVGYRVEEPFVHAKFTVNNSPIYADNDVEMFIAGKDAYYEFEINGYNTTYEAFFIWQEAYESGGFSQAPEFQRSLLQTFNGIGFRTHPRGQRFANFDWHFPGKKTAVWIDGTVNNDRDRDRGWTVELAFPWKGMAWLAKADGRSLPPKDGDVWRIDFSRFNSYKEAPPALDSGGWFWSRHGVWDSHVPECFPYIKFSTNDVSEAAK